MAENKRTENTSASTKKAIDAYLDSLAGEIATSIMEEEMPSQIELLPPKAKEEQIHAALANFFHGARMSLERGVSTLLHTLVQLAKNNPSYFSENVANDLCKFVEFSSNLAEFEYFQKYLEGISQKSIQEMSEMSDETLQYLYEAAKYLYEQHEFELAADAFGVLTLLNVKKPVFLIGLANSSYSLGNFEDALAVYALCAYIHPLEYSCHLYSCKCYEELHQIDLAINSLDLALISLGDDPEQESLRQEILIEQERLSEKLQNKKEIA